MVCTIILLNIFFGYSQVSNTTDKTYNWFTIPFTTISDTTLDLLMKPEGINKHNIHWYKFDLASLQKIDLPLVVDLGFSDHADIFCIADSSSRYLGTIGYFVAKNKWPLNNEFLNTSPTQFIIDTIFDSYYIKFKRISPWAKFTPRITKVDIWQKERIDFLLERNITQGIFYGAMIIMMLFNLFIYFIYKDKAYLFYVLYILSLCFALLPPFELAYSTFFANAPHLLKHLEMLGDFGFIIFYFLFISSFLNIKTRLPWTYRYIKYYLIFIVSSFVICQLIFLLSRLYYPTQYIYQINSAIGALLTLFVFYKLLRQKDVLPKFIITGTLLAMLGSVSVLFGAIFNSSFPHMQHYLMEAGHFAELLMFSIGLGVRFRLVEKERSRFKEVDELKMRFFANLTHEFRTPLTLIITPLEENIKKGKELSKNMVELVLKNAHKLLELINQLLSLSKLEAGKMTLNPTGIDIFEYVRSYSMTFLSLAEIKKVDLKVNYHPKPIYINIDVEKFNKILNNLIFNAIKFTHKNGSVTISTIDKGKYANIIIADTGAGISKEKLPFIFDRFFQSDTNNSNQISEGTGIGLSLTKELVELHKGTIFIDSKQCEGTKVTISVPKLKQVDKIVDYKQKISNSAIYPLLYSDLTSNNEEPIIVPDETEINANSKILLLVEDNVDVRKLIRDNIVGDFTLIEAANGNEGLQLANKYIPDIILTDLMMPEMDGIEFTHAIKSSMETSHIPVIMLTARGELNDKLKGLETGADAYLVKPFIVDELNAHIANLLKQREKLRELFSKQFKPEKRESQLPLQEQKFIKLTENYIEQYLSDEEFDIEQLSDLLKINRSSLFRKLKSITGYTPSQYLRIYRLNKSVELLKTENLTISEIAFNVGFGSVSYFNKLFKEYFKVTPSEYISL